LTRDKASSDTHTYVYTQMVISKSYFCFFWEDKWDKKGSYYRNKVFKSWHDQWNQEYTRL